MQRSALYACLFPLLITGCQTAEQIVTVGPLPEPVLRTRALPATRARPRLDALRPPTPPDATTRAVVQVPGGIQRGRWRTIVIHHSASPGATPESMDQYHRQVRQWENGLGYHFVIGNGENTPDGALFVGPRWTRQLTGAHCKSAAGQYLGRWCADNHFNEHGIGICLIGNFEYEPPTPAQLRTLHDLLCVLIAETGVRPSEIHGHGDVTHRTACPGRYLDVAAVRRQVSTTLAYARQPTGGTASAIQAGQ